MTSTPLVSVVVPHRDAERFLRDAVASVHAQSYENWELLLVDDGSTDGGPAIARELATTDPRRIRALQHPGGENRGASRSRNLGLESARGELVAFLDADDVWIPSKLAEQVALFAAEPRASLVYGTRELWGASDRTERYGAYGSIVALGIAGDRLYPPPILFRLTFAERRATIPSASDLMVRRDRALHVGGFEDAFRSMYDDQAFLAKVYLREPVWVSSRCWTRYRQHAGSCVARWAESADADSVSEFFGRWLHAYVRDWPGDDGTRRAVRRALFWHRNRTVSRILGALSRRMERRGVDALR